MRVASAMHSDKTKARLLALAMHALFIVLIVFGVSWQKKPQTPVTADLWSNLPPLPPPRAVEAPPAPQAAPEPPPKAAPRVPPPPPKVERTPPPKPDIVVKKVEKEKKAEPRAEPRPEPKKREDDKIARLQKEAEAKAQREQDQQRELADKEARAAADKAAAEKAAAERAARAAAARDNQKYIAGIYGKVYARLAVPPDVQGNPEAEFTVALLPSGELDSVTMRRSSGNAAYDAAIERAIRAAQPFVVPSGDEFQRSFRRFPMVFRPRQ